MQIVEYSASEHLHQPLRSSGIVKRNITSLEEGAAEIERLFFTSGHKVTGYNQELDYYWGRKASPSRDGRRILRIEP